jgi:SAM-dependent methyltransferase
LPIRSYGPSQGGPAGPLATDAEFDQAPGVTDHDLPSLRAAWEANALDWAAWARTPDHDHFFWYYNLPRFLEIVPPPGALTLDVGCGEGRVARALTELGHRVVGFDGSPTLARLARTHHEPIVAVNADAAALPVADGAADGAVAFMSLQDVDDLEGALHELGRVLRPAGTLCLAILHPMVTAGDDADDATHLDFVINHRYSSPRRFVDDIERDGLRMQFHSIHRPLEAYVDALHDAGFVIELLREPVPDAAAIARFPRFVRQDRIPWYLHVRAIRRA